MTKEKCLNEINEHIYNKLIYSWLCDQLEEELLTFLQRCRGILQAALEALNQYRVITSHFPSKYLEQCRSYLWEHCLDEVVNTNETIPHDR